MARKCYDDQQKVMSRMEAIIKDHTTTLAMMQSTINFQGSFVGDLGESVDKYTTEVNEHIKEAVATSKAHRKKLQDQDERITRRRGEIDDINTLVRIS